MIVFQGPQFKWNSFDIFQALGPADYIYISQIFHTILIRNVPKMNLTYRNQARRFICLIDILYGNRVSPQVHLKRHTLDFFPEFYELAQFFSPDYNLRCSVCPQAKTTFLTEVRN